MTTHFRCIVEHFYTHLIYKLWILICFVICYGHAISNCQFFKLNCGDFNDKY